LIKVEGLSLEKFINLTISKGIYLWKIDRTAYTSLRAYINIRDFPKLRPILRTVRCRVKILEKRGLPFFIFRFKHRKMLIAGMVLFLVLLYSVSSFVWTVEVEGNERLDSRVIVRFLEKNGIKPGVWKGNIDINKVENRMMIDIPELAWIGIEIRGTKAIARVVEAVLPPKVIQKDTPCNIIAAKDGIISRMIVLDGQAKVKVGQTVKKGQLLVSGIIEHPDTGSVRYVHAMAQIIARTWYEGRGKAFPDQVKVKRTGRKVVCKYLELGNRQIEYHREEIPFDKYEVEEKREPVLGKGSLLPMNYLIREFYEVVDMSEEERMALLRKMAEKRALEDLSKKIPPGAKIIDKTMKYDMIEGEGLRVIIYAEILEDIALQEKISAPENANQTPPIAPDER